MRLDFLKVYLQRKNNCIGIYIENISIYYGENIRKI